MTTSETATPEIATLDPIGFVIPGPRSGTRNPEMGDCDWQQIVGLVELADADRRAKIHSSPLWIPGSAARPRNDENVGLHA
jgi:hypothetical protein